MIQSSYSCYRSEKNPSSSHCHSERRRSLACERSSRSRNLLFAFALVYLLCVFVAAFFPTLVLAQELPKGWRHPTRSETSDDWRKKSPTRFVALKGDFDGDGKFDTAELLVNPSKHRFAVFLKLGSSASWQEIGDEIEMKWLGQMGIDLVKRGKYETACGKGYDDSFCAHGEPDYLTIETAAIDLFIEESADSMLYWDKKQKKFRTIQMSD
jgi:hypothetical protein